MALTDEVNAAQAQTARVTAVVPSVVTLVRTLFQAILDNAANEAKVRQIATDAMAAADELGKAVVDHTPAAPPA